MNCVKITTRVIKKIENEMSIINSPVHFIFGIKKLLTYYFGLSGFCNYKPIYIYRNIILGKL